MLKPKPSNAFRIDTTSIGLVLILLLIIGGVSFMGGLFGSLYAYKISMESFEIASGPRAQASNMMPQPTLTDVDGEHGKSSGPAMGGMEAIRQPEAASEPEASPSVDMQPSGVPRFDCDIRTRTEWQKITQSVCLQRNYTSCRDINRASWTVASKSSISKLEFAGLGAWSTFKIKSHDSDGKPKSMGGDSWVIQMREKEQMLRVPARVFDDGDGSYTVAVYFLHPGKYSLWAWLWYSDCHGYQEPNEGLDEIFTHHQEFFGSMKKPDHCYIGERLRLPADGKFDIPDSAPSPPCMQRACAASAAAFAPDIKASKSFHSWRTEMYHVHRNMTFTALPCCKPRLPVRKAKDKAPQRFLFCGDSTVYHSWDIMVQSARRPCKFTWNDGVRPVLNNEHLLPDLCPAVPSFAEMDPEFDTIVRRCTAGAPWTTVPVGADTPGSARNSKFPLYIDMKNFQWVPANTACRYFDNARDVPDRYNDTFALTHVPPVHLPLKRNFTVVFLEHGTIRTTLGVSETLANMVSTDVLVISMGPHYSRLMQFEVWRAFTDELAALLLEIKTRTGAMIVWRTSFLVKESALRSYETHGDKGYVDTAHFNTDARRMLFDSYAEFALEKIGVHIWDVYGMSAVGEYRPADMFHAAGPSTWAQNADMMDLFACKA